MIILLDSGRAGGICEQRLQTYGGELKLVASNCVLISVCILLVVV